MKYIKLFEGFKESEFIRTKTYKNYVINKFQPGDIDNLLDSRFRFKELRDESNDDLEITNYNKEIKAIDYIISKHF
jgi:hypothetical protein